MVTAVFIGIAVCMTLIYTILLPKDKISKIVSVFVNKNILYIGFLISFAAMISSLIYSEIIGYPPCMLCWYARIFFYPQVFIFGRAIVKKDKNVLPYSMILSVLGLILMIYHSTIVITGESALPCVASGVSCLSRDVFAFGFITIPFMGAVGFASLVLSLLIAKKAEK
jgi:disulfide bond formation protein DsbB